MIIDQPPTTENFRSQLRSGGPREKNFGTSQKLLGVDPFPVGYESLLDGNDGLIFSAAQKYAKFRTKYI